jgi:hypothetical protein
VSDARGLRFTLRKKRPGIGKVETQGEIKMKASWKTRTAARAAVLLEKGDLGTEARKQAVSLEGDVSARSIGNRWRRRDSER